MRPDRQEFTDGDIVRDRQGNVGRVIRCFSKSKRTYYQRVRIDQGPRRGEWEWPEKFVMDDGDPRNGNVRPAHEEEDYIGSQDHKTRHHAR